MPVPPQLQPQTISIGQFHQPFSPNQKAGSPYEQYRTKLAKDHPSILTYVERIERVDLVRIAEYFGVSKGHLGRNIEESDIRCTLFVASTPTVSGGIDTFSVQRDKSLGDENDQMAKDRLIQMLISEGWVLFAVDSVPDRTSMLEMMWFKRASNI